MSSTRFTSGRPGQDGSPPEGTPYPNSRLQSALCLRDARLPVPDADIRGGAGGADDAVPRAVINKRSDGLGGSAVAMPPRLRRMQSTHPAISGFRRPASLKVRRCRPNTPAHPLRRPSARWHPPECGSAAIKKTRGRSPAPVSISCSSALRSCRGSRKAYGSSANGDRPYRFRLPSHPLARH